jgi:uncharacterized protein (DUF1015 family)
MADVLPFVATRFSSRAGEDLSTLVTPPYDVIDAKLQQAFYDADPHNIIRVDFGKDLPGDTELENRYARAGAIWMQWKDEGILQEERNKSFYVYEQEFALPSGDVVKRRGFFGAVKLQDFSEGGIRAHEHTFDGPKADRFRLMRATNCNLSPIFCLFDDPTKKVDELLEQGIAGQKPQEADFQGVKQRLWIVTKPNVIEGIRKLMADQTLFIADGHHRYETSLLFRNEMRTALRQKNGRQPFDYTMMYLNNIHDDGLVILPTHRILSKDISVGIDVAETLEDIREYFEVTPITINQGNLEEESRRITTELAAAGEKALSFVMLLPKCKAFLLTMKPDTDLNDLLDDEETPQAIKALDVTVLHQYLINRAWLGNPEMELDDQDVIYEKDAGRAIQAMCSCKHGVAFLLNPTKIEQVCEIAQAGLRMPHKSTYFYPKLVTGLVMRDLNSPW